MNKIQIVPSDVGKKVWGVYSAEFGIIYAVGHSTAHVGYPDGTYGKYTLDGTRGGTIMLQWERPKRKVTKTLELWTNLYGKDVKGAYYTREGAAVVCDWDGITVHMTGTYEVEVEDAE